MKQNLHINAHHLFLQNIRIKTKDSEKITYIIPIPIKCAPSKAWSNVLL